MSTVPTTDDPFTSLSALRAEHRNLQKLYREQPNSEEVLARIERFIRRGVATGAILDTEDDQAAAQSLLDLWATTLYRANRVVPDATLAPFDKDSAPVLDESTVPYVGMDSFAESKKDVFFGRERPIANLIARLQKENLIAVIGPSGSGKSSLVLAGVVPALEAGALPDSAQWRYLGRMVPGSNPLANLARLLRAPDQGSGWITEQANLIRNNPGYLLTLLQQISPDQPTVLVIDQFEECSTLCEDGAIREAFEDCLVRLVTASDPRHIVILTMRSDFIGAVARTPQLQQLLETALEPVTPMSAGELREAIERPAEKIGLKFEPGVVEALVHDILGEPAALPLLQFTLLKLWEHREHNQVTIAAYKQLGGGRLALTHSADQFFSSLIPEEQIMADRIFMRLVRPGIGQDNVANRVRRNTLYSIGPKDNVDRVLNKLIYKQHLIRLTSGDTDADDEVEIAHEALVRNWPRLVTLLERERERMTTGRRLQMKAADWLRLGRGEAGLLKSAALAEAEAWLANPDSESLGVSEELRSLVSSSRKAEDSAREREFRIKIALVALAMASLVFAGFSLHLFMKSRAGAAKLEVLEHNEHDEKLRAQNSAAEAVLKEQQAMTAMKEEAAAKLKAQHFEELAEAQARSLKAVATELAERGLELAKLEEKEHAEKLKAQETAAFASSGEMASDIINTVEANPERSILLGLAAAWQTYGTYKTINPKVADALDQAVQDSRQRLLLTGHGDRVISAAFSPDGTVIATGSFDHKAKLWDATSGKWLRDFNGHGKEVRGIAFNYDGKILATASSDGTAKLWNVATGSEIRTLQGHNGIVTEVAFSPDGTKVATASFDTTVKIWDVSSGKCLLTLIGHSAPVRSVVWSSNGKWIATGAEDRTARIWNAETGVSLRKLSAHQDIVYSVAFNPNGNRLATAGADKKVIVWDTTSGDQTLTLLDAGEVYGVSFSPDGTRLATASKDRTAKIWDARNGNKLVILPGSGSDVRGVAFSPDGRRLVSASLDKTAIVWDLSAGRDLLLLPAHEGGASAVAFSPDGKQIATGGRDGEAKVWDAATGEEELDLNIQKVSVDGVAFSPDGTRLASVSWGKMAKIWEVRTGKELLSLSGARLTRSAYSPDGKLLALASDDHNVEIWDIASSTKIGSLKGHTDMVFDVAFSPDGKLLATASWDKSAKLWDLKSQKELRTLVGHTDMVHAVAFSPDGRMVGTGSEDGTARLWDVATGRLLKRLAAPDDDSAVLSLAFSPDGQHLTTGSNAGQINIWDVASGRIPLPIKAGSRVWAVAYSPDGKKVAAATADERAELWDANSGQPLFRLSGHKDQVLGVAFSPNGEQVATTSADKTAKLWDATSGALQTTLPGFNDWVIGVAFNPRDGKNLATASLDGTARIWEISTGKPITARLIKAFTEGIGQLVTVAFSPDGKYFVTAGGDTIPVSKMDDSATPRYTATLRETASGKIVRSFTGHKDYVNGVAFDRTGKRLLTGSGDGTAKLWEVETGALLKTFPGHSGFVAGVAFSPDDKWVATANADATATIWDVDSGAEVRTLVGHSDALSAIAFSPDGTKVATASDDQKAKVWDPKTGHELLSFSGHHGKILSLAFNANGTRLATASQDGTVRIYELDPVKLMVTALRRVIRGLPDWECKVYLRKETCPDEVISMALFADGERLARTGDLAGAIKDFNEAREKNPNLDFEPEAEAVRSHADAVEESKRAFAYGEINIGRLLVRQGKVPEAINAYSAAQSTQKLSAADLNSLCWYGAIWGHASEVMTYCEKAVALDPESGSIRDSRGVAEVLTGQFEEAIDDFISYIVETKNEKAKKQRTEWVEALRSGKNPLTPEVLENLRSQ